MTYTDAIQQLNETIHAIREDIRDMRRTVQETCERTSRIETHLNDVNGTVAKAVESLYGDEGLVAFKASTARHIENLAQQLGDMPRNTDLKIKAVQNRTLASLLKYLGDKLVAPVILALILYALKQLGYL